MPRSATPSADRPPEVVAPRTVAIVGPTATGKTALAVALARRLGNTELLSADSRQLLRGLHVGTCAPTEAELGGVTCHLLDLAEPGARFTVADWLVAARATLAGLDERGIRALVVGGTGLYVRALLDGYHIGDTLPNPAQRARRERSAACPVGLAELVTELRRRAPEAASGIDLANPRRVIRALEMLDHQPSSLAARERRGPPRPALRIGVSVDREFHRSLITTRARHMVERGTLLAETASALERGVPAAILERAGIGYREALDLRGGVIDTETAIGRIVQRTVRYSKAQRTFFRGDPEVRWVALQSGDLGDLVGRVITAISEEPG
ncbi:MAG: tRNA (adenosine(37)-N6)-dimethylallyltransferase MiaA [Candidatus Dormibacteria bacterium]